MRAFFLIILLLAPFALADGWYYPGDTFEANGILHSVEGSNHESVLVGVGAQLHLLRLDECKDIGFTKYCYDDTGYPDDEDHIKYAAGERYFGYHLSITTTAPDIKVTRSIDDSSPELGQRAALSVTFENEGDYDVRDVTFTEDIPEGLRVVSGPGSAQRIDFILPDLGKGKTYTMRYSLEPKRYGSFILDPNVTYRYKQTVKEEELGPVTIDVATPLEIDSAASATIGFDEDGWYEINLSNEGEQPLDYSLSLAVPEGLSPTSETAFEGRLEPGEDASHRAEFYGAAGGNHKIRATIESELLGTTIAATDERTVKVLSEGLSPSLLLSSAKSAYAPGAQLTLTSKLANTNAKTRFTNVQGTVESELFASERFDISGISPGAERTASQFRFTVPEVNGTFPILLNGSYKTPRGRMLSFSKRIEMKIARQPDVIELTRTISPQRPVPGENVTITVRAKNAYDRYITLTAHERLGARKVAGITYKETSLDAGASEDLYTYQVEAPGNGSFTVTTFVQAKDEALPQEFTEEIFITEPEEHAALEDIDPEEVQAEKDERESKEEMGFLASVWDFLKGLFD